VEWFSGGESNEVSLLDQTNVEKTTSREASRATLGEGSLAANLEE
jgi:hypothetical protein